MHVFDAATNSDTREKFALELRNLAETAGAVVVGELSQVISQQNPATMIGAGKVDDLASLVEQQQAELVIFGCDLTGSQVRNIEEVCPARVIDRTQLILDIFASRANSFEGKAQVKLAQLSYLLPRLVGRGKEMSRLGGGIGTRGPGETKLESDRRKIRKEISDLRRVLHKEGVRRQELRRRRSGQGVYSVGLVGYTNAGKTTLLSQLAKRYGEKPLAQGQNRLFDTLDLSSRRIVFSGRTFVFTDTVGFLRELPHHLIDAFRATLEEAVDADVLVHVVDASSQTAAFEMQTVYRVLEEELHVKAPIVTFLNEKVDAADGKQEVSPDLLIDQKAFKMVRGSALANDAIERLLDAVDEVIGRKMAMHLYVPHDRSDVVADAYRLGMIEQVFEQDDFLLMDLLVDQREAAHFLPFTQIPDSHEEHPM